MQSSPKTIVPHSPRLHWRKLLMAVSAAVVAALCVSRPTLMAVSPVVGGPQQMPTPAPRLPGVVTADAQPAMQALPLKQLLGSTLAAGDGLRPLEQPVTPGVQPLGIAPSAVNQGEYYETFYGYAVDQLPAGWSWFSSDWMVAAPSVAYFGGATDDYKRVAFPEQTVNPSKSFLIRDGMGYTPYRQLTGTINFQTNTPGLAGMIVGWKDFNNYAAVLLDPWTDTAWILQVSGGQENWETNGYGATPLEPYLDYRLIAYSPTWADRGVGKIQLWIKPPNGDLYHVFTSANSYDIRGRMGMGTMDGTLRVLFDDYWAIGEAMPSPGFSFTSPTTNGQTANVYGDSIWMAGDVTNDIAVWEFVYWWFDVAGQTWRKLAVFPGSSPYGTWINTGLLNFEWNQIDVYSHNIDGSVYFYGNIWLYRLREPNSVTSDPPNLTLTANGQQQAPVVFEVRDRGGNLLPDVEVAVTAQKATVSPNTVRTTLDGRAAVTVTAGILAGAGKLFYQSGLLTGTVDVALVAGPPATLQLTANKAELVADGAGAAQITAELKDAFGNPTPGQEVKFAATLGSIPGAGVTNNLGKTTVTFTTGKSLGAAQITAGHGALGGSTSLALVAGPPAQLAVKNAPAQLYADGASAGDVRVQLADAYGHPLPNRTVLFSTSAGSIDASAATNEDGMATARLRAGSVIGSAAVQATISGLSAAVAVPLVAGPPSALRIDPLPEGVVADGANSVSVTVMVRDGRDRPIAGMTTLFSTTVGSITPAAVTNAEGVATAQFTPPKTVGRARVTASAGGVVTEMELVLKASFASVYLAYVERSEPLPVLANGNFDAGDGQGWTQLVSGSPGKLIYQRSDNREVPPPVSPPFVAWLGGEVNKVNQLSQPVAAPAGYGIALEFAYYQVSEESACGQDVAVVEVVTPGGSRTLHSFGLCGAADTKGWRTQFLDLGTLRGQSFTLQFRSVLNGAANSNLFLDNVRICTKDAGAPAAVPRCAAQ